MPEGERGLMGGGDCFAGGESPDAASRGVDFLRSGTRIGAVYPKEPGVEVGRLGWSEDFSNRREAIPAAELRSLFCGPAELSANEVEQPDKR